MFKAKLIESPEYYQKRKIRVILYFLPPIPIAILINYYSIPLWLNALAILAYVAIIIIKIRNEKKLTYLTSGRMLELDDAMLRIKSKGGDLGYEIHLDGIKKITIPGNYGIPEESMKDIANEMSGETKRNFIEISDGHQKQRFDFIIDSYYMLKKLDNVIESWGRKGYLVDRV